MGIFTRRKKVKVASEKKVTSEKEVKISKSGVPEYVTPENYPPIVKEIHNHFYTAADKLILENDTNKQKSESKEIKKGKSLADLGFKKAQQVKEAVEVSEKVKLSEEGIKKLNEYKIKYPGYKFITEPQVEEICKKYGLVLGDVGKYTGFVPDKNRKEILNFPGLKKEHIFDCEIVSNRGQIVGYVKKKEILNNYVKNRVEEGSDAFVELSSGPTVVGGERKWGQFSKIRLTESKGLMICAPLKDMDMEGMVIEEGYKMKKVKKLIDPVVLQRVPEGYLILTAWGPEASDPNVVNEMYN